MTGVALKCAIVKTLGQEKQEGQAFVILRDFKAKKLCNLVFDLERFGTAFRVALRTARNRRLSHFETATTTSAKLFKTELSIERDEFKF